MIEIKVNVNRRIPAIRQDMQRGFSGEAGPIQDAFKQWAVRYRSEMQLRFNQYSRGGGNWPPLKSTSIQNRVGKPLTRLKKAFARGDIDEATYLKRRKSTKAKVKRQRKAFRSNQGGGRISILRDTGLLFNTLDPAFTHAPGQLERYLGNGVEVGIGGPAGHGVGPATIGDIANYHQTGAGSLPVRQILVSPSVDTLKGMTADLDRAADKIIRSQVN